MLVTSESDRLHQPRIDPRQLPSLDHRSGRDLEEVENLSHSQSIAATAYLKHDDRTLIRRPPLLLQEQMPVENGEQGASDVYQPFNRLGHARNPGGLKAGKDLTHDPCRGRADNLTDSKDDGVERGRVSHLY